MTSPQPDVTLPTPVEQALLDRLLVAVERRDPVPGGVRETAVGLFAWRSIDAELAALVSDSFQQDATLAGSVRDSGRGGPRQLTFSGPDCLLELEAATDPAHPDRVRLVGQVVPLRDQDDSAQARVLVRSRDAVAADVQTDALGRFDVVVAVGALTFRVALEGDGVLETDWVEL